MRFGLLRPLVLLTAVILLTSGCSLSLGTESSQTASPQATGSPGGSISHYKSQYTDALGKAKAWQDNATLTRVYRKYSGTITPKQPQPLIFSFGSLANPQHAHEVSLTDKSEREATVTKPDFELAMVPIDTAEWMIDPDTALATGEQAGGAQFREQHLAGYTVLVQLSKQGAFPLQWYVRYDTGDGTKKRYEVFINALTGEVTSQKES